MGHVLEVAEGLRYQTSDETRIYTITTTNLVSNPTSPTAVVYDEATEENVTETTMSSGSHTVSGNTIYLKPLTALTAGHIYRVEVQFTVGSNLFERFFRVSCPKLGKL